jgi:hypothetical protein
MAAAKASNLSFSLAVDSHDFAFDITGKQLLVLIHGVTNELKHPFTLASSFFA